MARIIFIFSLSWIVFGSLQAQDKTQLDTTETNVYMVAEHMPEFPGGFEALMNYIRKNLRIPAKDRDFVEDGAVYTSIAIDEKGNVEDVKILRGGSKELDEEVIRVLKSMPKWKPGRQEGKNVKVRFNFPIRFVK
jgi:periplasmic protein TonB